MGAEGMLGVGGEGMLGVGGEGMPGMLGEVKTVLQRMEAEEC